MSAQQMAGGIRIVFNRRSAPFRTTAIYAKRIYAIHKALAYDICVSLIARTRSQNGT